MPDTSHYTEAATFWENAIVARQDDSGSDGFTYETDVGHRLLVVKHERMHDDMLAIIAHFPDDSRRYHGDHMGETDSLLRNVQTQQPIYAYRPAASQHRDAPHHWTIFSGWDGPVTGALSGRTTYWIQDMVDRDESDREWSLDTPSATPQTDEFGYEAGARNITDYTTDSGPTMRADTGHITRQVTMRDLDDDYRF